jgi:hypothetical protein
MGGLPSVAGLRAVAGRAGAASSGARILRGTAETIDAVGAHVEAAAVAAMIEATAVDAHPYRVGSTAEALRSLGEGEPETAGLELSGERLLDAGPYELFEAGMGGELCREIVKQPVRPGAVHAWLLASAEPPVASRIATRVPSGCLRGISTECSSVRIREQRREGRSSPRSIAL